MTFEEQFPSIWKHRLVSTEPSGFDEEFNLFKQYCRESIRGICKIPGTFIWVQEDIERYCLDKQKVREAILHITSPQSSERVELLKELGL